MIPSTILKLIDELDALGKQRDDAWQVPRAEGELLYQIALATGAKRIVEVGTSYGFSGLFWGAAMRRTGGHLHTIDRETKKYESSKQTFAQAGLSDVITNHLGDARRILADLPAGIDLAFIDADKKGTRDYFDLIWPKLRIGGSILVDNATTHKSELSQYVQFVRSLKDAGSVEVAVGNGLEWTVRLA
ncbi:MAG: class I SAM-dependent methyltransferase [Phycisphaerales bacterium]|jgi:predicted O-methyltransferase YrrM|nr:class I SAM-dependent methyltransferase [Phycisphaerales bacterium]